ncbi:MAG: NifU N-terminal domain-containing protein [Acidimicrobiales bacterium]|nr:NifU N-terminal domain-containing protein [Acidimicrobiales bacterium]
MGQPITVIAKPSTRPGIIRYEVNRNLTGTGHQIYRSESDAVGAMPADELARRLFDRGGIESVHVYNNVITVQLADSSPPSGIEEIIRDLFLYYRDGVVPEVPSTAAS